MRHRWPSPLPEAAARQVAGDQTATIDWTTTKVATSEVLLGTTATNLKSAKAQGGSTRKHSLTVRGLKPGKRYYYRVVSTDTAGAKTTAPALTAPAATFVTAALDTVAPTATVPNITPLPDGTALVRWTTNEPTSSTVAYGSLATKLVERVMTEDLSTKHKVVLTGLTPGSTYWVRTKSADAAGNVVITTAARFVTPAAGVAQQSVESLHARQDHRAPA